MNQLAAIAKNTLLQTFRQPLYGIIVIVTLGGIALAPSLTGWTLDDDNKLLRDIGLSTLLIQGLFLAAFAASSVIDSEIEDKTVLTVAAKPVSRGVFVLGKYLGVLGAILAAHYLAGIAFYMAMRHGVLQSASEEPDMTVIVLGPLLMVVLALAATVLNYLYEWRFLPTLVTLALPFATMATGVLLVMDRDWKLAAYETTQELEKLPSEAAEESALKGIIWFRPSEGEARLAGHKGQLVRNDWKGPISNEEQDYLLGLHDSIKWRQDVNFLVEETRKKQGTEIFKAGCLTLVAVALLAAFAVAASTRLGTLGTFLVCFVALCAGLCSDQLIRPLAEDGIAWARWVYPALPNFQFFWMVDALSEQFIIPWRYVLSAAGYGAVYTLAIIALATAMFETREVG
ncbi:MAG TPA: ABC transporter permease [Phycisphaerae bacterium]|nr:ABC transporter permease [Phycisphaerae bacterium]